MTREEFVSTALEAVMAELVVSGFEPTDYTPLEVFLLTRHYAERLADRKEITKRVMVRIVEGIYT